VTAPASPLRLRLVAPLAGLTLLAVFAALYLGDRPLYFQAMGLWGVPALKYPFLDWDNVSASIDCWKKGVNVYVRNPCDIGRRAFPYSPLWLGAGFVPTGPVWRNVIGLAIGLSFLASLFFAFRPRSRGEAALFTLAGVSSMAAYGVERANVDLLLFVMVVAAGGLGAGPARRRWLAYGLLFFAGLLKFYPLAGLLTALRERFAVLAGVAALTTGGLLVFAHVYRAQLAAMRANVPGGKFGYDTFGASNLLFVLPASSDWVRPVVFAALALCALAVAISIARGAGFARALAATGPVERSLLILCAAIIVGCFFAGQSIVYRGVFLAPVVAGLLAMRRASDEAAARRRLAWLTAVILGLMWEGAWRPLLAPSPVVEIYLVRELLWWWVVASLMAVLLVFAAQSPAFADLRGLAVRWRPR